MQIVLFASGDGHLVLNIAKVKNLFFELLFDAAKLLGLGIELGLHLV